MDLRPNTKQQSHTAVEKAVFILECIDWSVLCKTLLVNLLSLACVDELGFVMRSPKRCGLLGQKVTIQ